MKHFTDEIKIRIKSGNGGSGAVSFRREKYIPRGGPDGGDGGKGGDVYFEADRRYYNLSHFFKDRLYKAENGKQGMGRNRHGRNGEDLIIKVPPGTLVSNIATGEVYAELIEEKRPVKVLEGGSGGKGNAFFKSSTQQTPRFAQPGEETEEQAVNLNLKLIADIGLVGLPNAGKSTLLSAITNANPKIGDYPFTTLIPNLGVLEFEDGTVYKIADIPGIIEGAHRGSGLGLSFLQHIERVKCILYIVDGTEQDIEYVLKMLKEELRTYNESLLHKKNLILISKIDLVPHEILDDIKANLGNEIIPISALEKTNLEDLYSSIKKIMENDS